MSLIFLQESDMEKVSQQNVSSNSGTAWYRRPEFWFFLTAIAGLLFRAEYLREFSAFEHFNCAVGADVQDYHDRALGILNGQIFSDVPDIHAPLYAFFLAGIYKVFGIVPAAARVVQLVLNWGAWLWLTFLLYKRGASRKESLIFLIFAMFTPVVVFHQAELISETLLVMIFALALGCFTMAEKHKSLRWQLGAGFAAGLGVLTHGFMWAYAAAETLYALSRKEWKKAGVFFCGVMLAVLPVIFAKSVYYEKLTPLQKNSVFNVWLGHNPKADGGCWLRPGEAWEREHRNTAKEAAERGITVERIYLERMAEFYRENPGAVVKLLVKKVWKLILPVEFIAGADSPAMIYKTNFQYYLRFIAAIVGFFAVAGAALLMLKPPQKFHAYIHFLLLTASLALAQVLTVTSGRYRMGMMPGVMLLAALAIAAMTRKQLFVACAGAVLLAGMLPSIPRIDPEERSNMGEAWYRCGKFDKADAALEYASRYIDHPTMFGNLRGIMAEKRGDFQQAEKFYLQAISDYDPEANFNLGMMLSKNFPSRREEALMFLHAGVRLDPSRPDAWNQIGVNAVYLGDWTVAEIAFEAALKLVPEHTGYRSNLEFVRKQRQKP